MTSENATDFKSALRVGSLSVGKVKLDEDWKPFTAVFSTGALGTTTVNRFRFRVIGKTVEITGAIITSDAGTLGSGSYQISLPTGCTAAYNQQMGGVATISGATKSYNCTVSMNSSTSQFILVINNPVNTTPALLAWASTSDAEVRLDAAGGFNVQIRAAFELDPASPILN